MQYDDGGANTLAAQSACSCVFSPVSPHFLLTGDNALLLTAFALAFSPVSPLSVAAFAALKVSFPGACPGKDDSSYFDEETTSSLRVARSNVFSSCSSFVFKERFRRAKTNLL